MRSCASLGSFSKDVTPTVEVFHPVHSFITALPFFSSIPTGMTASVSSTSSFVMFQQAHQLIIAERLRSGRCSQPQRRGRFVTEPYSPPRSRRRSPVSPSTSVRNSPAPTLVQYALATPMTSPRCFGAIPKPCSAPPILVELLVKRSEER